MTVGKNGRPPRCRPVEMHMDRDRCTSMSFAEIVNAIGKFFERCAPRQYKQIRAVVKKR